MTSPHTGEGLASVSISPPYIALGTSADEVVPMHRRGQIRWGQEHGLWIGHAAPWTPTGDYTHVLYFRGPTDPPCYAAQIDQPQHQHADGPWTVGPIVCAYDEMIAQL